MWNPPDLVNLESVNVKLRRPPDLDVPSCPSKPDLETGPDYFKKLDKQASKLERQENFRASGYLYGLIFQFGTEFYAHGSVNTLYAETKLAYCLYRGDRFGSADRVAKDAFVLAEKIRNRGHKSDLATYCIKSALAVVGSLAKKYFNQAKYDLAQQGFEYGLQKSKELLGGDEETTKDFEERWKQCSDRIRSQAAEAAASSSETPPRAPSPAAKDSKTQPASKSRSNSPSQPKPPANRPDGSSTPKASTPNRDSTSPVRGSSTSQTNLTVPNSLPFGHVPSRSPSNRSRNRANSDNTSKDADPDRKKSRSVSPGNLHVGHCFDSVIDNGMSVTLAEWAKDLSISFETRNLLKETQEFLTRERGGYQDGNDPKNRRIRVAVLDTGFDATQLRKKRKRIKTHCTIPGMEKEGNKDDDGHGTNIVRLIFDVAAEVDVYVWRVFKSTKEVTSDWVEPAIRAAIDAEVDIITLSFGFEIRQRQIRAALKDAIARDILVFAAASNFGGRSDIPIAWPAREHGIFCVFATDDEGNDYKHNPSADHVPVRFATFGENIKSSRNITDNALSLSGTSYATPIVAATAALFLDFARLCTMGNTPGPITHYDAVHYFESIEALLKESSVERHGLRYIKPWLIFKSNDWNREQIAYNFNIVLRKVHGVHAPPE